MKKRNKFIVVISTICLIVTLFCVNVGAVYTPDSKGYLSNVTSATATVIFYTDHGSVLRLISLNTYDYVASYSGQVYNSYKGLYFTEVLEQAQEYGAFNYMTMTVTINTQQICMGGVISLSLGSSNVKNYQSYNSKYVRNGASVSFDAENTYGETKLHQWSNNLYAITSFSFTIRPTAWENSNISDYEATMQFLQHGYVVIDDGKYWDRVYNSDWRFNEAVLKSFQEDAVARFKTSYEFRRLLASEYQRGYDNANDAQLSITDTFNSITQVPLNVIGGLLNHTIFGVNVLAVFGALVAVALGILLVRLWKH